MYDALNSVSTFNTVAGNARVVRKLDDPSILTQMSLIKEELKETEDALADNNLLEVLDGAADLIVVAAGLIHKLGFCPNDVMSIVNLANLSKFCSTEEEAEQSVLAYKEDSRYSDVEYIKRGNLWVVRGKKVGEEGNDWKVLKSYLFRKPDKDLKTLIEETLK